MVDRDPRVDFHPLIERWAALDWGGYTDAFLAIQGDGRNAQWHIFLTMIGAISAQMLFAKLQEMQLQVSRR